MGQIKNIKLHIVTDIKMMVEEEEDAYQPVSSGEDGNETESTEEYGIGEDATWCAPQDVYHNPTSHSHVQPLDNSNNNNNNNNSSGSGSVLDTTQAKSLE